MPLMSHGGQLGGDVQIDTNQWIQRASNRSLGRSIARVRLSVSQYPDRRLARQWGDDHGLGAELGPYFNRDKWSWEWLVYRRVGEGDA